MRDLILTELTDVNELLMVMSEEMNNCSISEFIREIEGKLNLLGYSIDSTDVDSSVFEEESAEVVFPVDKWNEDSSFNTLTSKFKLLVDLNVMWSSYGKGDGSAMAVISVVDVEEGDSETDEYEVYYPGVEYLFSED